jgi:putative membrane-bound dehydrogenase-like protein
MNSFSRVCSYASFAAIVFFSACSKKEAPKIVLNEEQLHQTANSLHNISLYEGLELTKFAAEPQLINPTNIDVDSQGRVWVCEAYNYRPEMNLNPTKKEGDRIIILEDTNLDGKADKETVFYQGPEVNAPLGIAVLGNKAYVSQSPYLWVFTDTNGDLKADTKEILFQGIEGQQHDHGVHAVVFGPDGKLYFNMGNEGKTLFDKNGKIVKTIQGKEVSVKNFQQGLNIRCDLDGSHVEVLAHNSRNSFENAINAFGDVWQTDNDDDGNEATRIIYVMNGGNYGYFDELTRKYWKENRTNIEEKINERHWHQNDPGVIPNVLITGSGSPSGLLIYEGDLLPKEFHNRMIHCEPGHNVLRAYSMDPNKAGFKTTITNIALDSTDQWFRPADVCTAPDGSLFVADWYDPGVGGHEAGDQAKGRIYRLAPKGHQYKPQVADVSSVAGAIKALESPNQATFYLAYASLLKFGAEAEQALATVFQTHAKESVQARALWLLSKGKNAQKYLDLAIESKSANIQLAGLRASREVSNALTKAINTLQNSSNPQLLRECALLLPYIPKSQIPALWTALALKHQGNDRFYLEALGIAARGNETECFNNYIAKNPNPLATSGGQDIVWRTHTESSLPFLVEQVKQNTNNVSKNLRYFRAMEYIESNNKDAYLLELLKTKANNPFYIAVFNALNTKTVKYNPEAYQTLEKVVASMEPTDDYFALVNRFQVLSQKQRLYFLATKQQGSGGGMFASKSLLIMGNKNILEKGLKTEPDSTKMNILETLRWIGTKESVDILYKTALDKSQPNPVRKAATSYIGNMEAGHDLVFSALDSKRIPDQFVPAAVEGLGMSWKKSVRERARKYLKADVMANGKPLPPINELIHMEGSIAKGKETYKAYCSTCHKIGAEGMDYGPGLSNIGGKLTKEAIYSAIIHPNIGISFGYEGYDIELKDGTKLSGLVGSKTETDVSLRMVGGASQNIRTSTIKSMKKLDYSIMPSGLAQSMGTEELVNLVTYLKTLK